jgi:hypothetical protein
VSLALAPGVVFDEDRHEYWYQGKKLSGVTGLISKKLALKMPEEFVGGHREEGAHAHKAVQRWIETGDPESVHPGVAWVTETLKPVISRLYSEVLVSDFKKYASAVDIAGEFPGKGLIIYDIKKGVFNREYVTWQLSIYKYFIGKHAGREVDKCYCICMRDREYYRIFPKGYEQVEKLLYGGRE